jgi:iron complex outermembrane receptor protein
MSDYRTVRVSCFAGIGAAILLASGTARAQTPAPASGTQPDGELLEGEQGKIQNIEQLDLASLLGTVSSVSRKTESVLKAPAAVTTLSADELRRSGAQMLPDLLRSVPGVQVYRNAAGSYVVSLRGTNGLANNNVVVLVDGVELNSPIDGSVDWAGIPVAVEDVEKVEVVRGPVSTIYGADAYTGVINIVTTGDKDAYAGNRARLYGGGDQRLSSLAGLSGRAGGTGENVTWQVSGNARYDGTFVKTALPSVNEPPLRQAGLLGRAELRTGEHSRWVFEGSGSINQKTSLDRLVLEANPVTDTLGLLSARYERTELSSWVDSVSAWVRGTYQHKTTDLELYKGLSYGGAQATRAEAGADLSFKLPASLSAGIGGDAGITRVDAPFINPLDNRKVRPGYGFYASLGADPTEALSFTAAARGDVSEITGKLQFSYRLSAIYALPSASFRITGSSAYRSPTWIEEAGRFTDRTTGLIFLEGSPSLLTPQVTSIEAAAILSPAAGLTISPTVYVEQLRNLLVEDFAPVVRKTFRNEPGHENLIGAELEARYRLSSDLSLMGSAAWLHWLDALSDTASIGVPGQNSALTLAARAQGSALQRQLAYGLGVTFASGREYGIRAGIPPQVIFASLPAQARLDGSISYRFSQRPWWIFLKGQTFLPGGEVESPLTLAAPLGSTVWAGLEYRP